MNDRQKVYIKEHTIEITQNCEAVVISSIHPDGDDRNFYIGDRYTGYIQPVFNVNGEPLESIYLIHSKFVISGIPLTCFRVLL